MNKTIEICEILDNIKSQLELFEKETIEIIECDIDEIEMHSEKRVEITRTVDGYFRQIDKVCDEMDKGCEVRRIIRNVTLFTDVSTEFDEIFRKSQQIFSIYTRIKDSDVQAVDRINLEKQILLKKIKETNSNQQAKASKFAVGMDDGARKYLGNGVKNA